MSDNIPLVAFYHITLINNWEQIFKSTLDTLIESNLYDALESINVGIVHTPNKPVWMNPIANYWNYDINAYNKFLDIISPYDKFKILFRKEEPANELSTYGILHDMCVQWSSKTPIPGYEKCNKKILYFHSKGVTHNNRNFHNWRQTMEEFLINQWQIVVEKLDTYDTVGCLQVDVESDMYFDNSGNHWKDYPLHYTGGYWWANSNYIGTKIDYKLNIRNGGVEQRIGPESWICTGSPKEKHFSMFDTRGRLPELEQVILPDKELWKSIQESLNLTK